MLSEIVWDGATVTAVMIFSVPIVSIIVLAWQRVECSRLDNELKRSMIERGMSADDIERVMAIRSPKKK